MKLTEPQIRTLRHVDNAIREAKRLTEYVAVARRSRSNTDSFLREGEAQFWPREKITPHAIMRRLAQAGMVETRTHVERAIVAVAEGMERMSVTRHIVSLTDAGRHALAAANAQKTWERVLRSWEAVAPRVIADPAKRDAWLGLLTKHACQQTYDAVGAILQGLILDVHEAFPARIVRGSSPRIEIEVGEDPHGLRSDPDSVVRVEGGVILRQIHARAGRDHEWSFWAWRVLVDSLPSTSGMVTGVDLVFSEDGESIFATLTKQAAKDPSLHDKATVAG